MGKYMKSASITQFLIIFLVIWVPTQNLLTRAYPILPAQLVWIDEGIIIILILSKLISFLLNTSKSPISISKIEILLVLFVIVGILSAILNNSLYLNTIMGFRSLIQYIPLYLILKREKISQNFARNFIIASLIISLIQLPVTTLQMMVALIRYGFIHDDIAFGTFSPTQANTLAYFIGTTYFLLFGIVKYKKKYQQVGILIAILLSIPFFASSSRAMFFLLPAVVLLINFKSIFTTQKKQILLITTSFILAFTLSVAYLVTKGYNLQRISLGEFLNDNLNINWEGDGGRLLHVIYTFYVLNETSWGLWIGMGPGMYTSSAGWYLDSPGMQTMNTYFGHALYGESYYPGYMTPGGEVFHVRMFSQLTCTFGEWGIIGFVLFFLMVANLARQGAQAERSSTSSSLVHILGAQARGIAWLCMVSTFLIPVWEEQPLAFLLWVTPGILVGLYRTEQQELTAPASSISAPPIPPRIAPLMQSNVS